MPSLSIVLPFSGARELTLALGLAVVNAVSELRRNVLPPLYLSGVRYKRDPVCTTAIPGACERFLSPLQAWAEFRAGSRWGLDCDDLAVWRAAELIIGGDRGARAVPIRSPAGWHVVVRHGDGTIEDPSLILGMIP